MSCYPHSVFAPNLESYLRSQSRNRFRLQRPQPKKASADDFMFEILKLVIGIPRPFSEHAGLPFQSPYHLKSLSLQDLAL